MRARARRRCRRRVFFLQHLGESIQCCQVIKNCLNLPIRCTIIYYLKKRIALNFDYTLDIQQLLGQQTDQIRRAGPTGFVVWGTVPRQPSLLTTAAVEGVEEEQKSERVCDGVGAPRLSPSSSRIPSGSKVISDILSPMNERANIQWENCTNFALYCLLPPPTLAISLLLCCTFARFRGQSCVDTSLRRFDSSKYTSLFRKKC